MNDPKPPERKPHMRPCSHLGCEEWGSFGHNVGAPDEVYFCRKQDPLGRLGERGVRKEPR
jgi:hypothetical protein